MIRDHDRDEDKAQTHTASYPPPQPAPPATSSSPPPHDDHHANDYTHLRGDDARGPHAPALSERVRCLRTDPGTAPELVTEPRVLLMTTTSD